MPLVRTAVTLARVAAPHLGRALICRGFELRVTLPEPADQCSEAASNAGEFEATAGDGAAGAMGSNHLSGC